MHEDPKRPRRVRVERGIYRNPSTGGYEIEYTDGDGRVRWRRVYGGLRDARLERAEVQTRLGRGERLPTSARSGWPPRPTYGDGCTRSTRLRCAGTSCRVSERRESWKSMR